MPHRPKILIIENDDFLREILGNLLHKAGYYILSDFCIEHILKEHDYHNISLVILGTSCKKFEGKKTIHYLQKILGQNIKYYIINNTEKRLNFIPKEQQILTSELSIQKILSDVKNMI